MPSDGPLKMSKEIWCPAKDKYVLVETSQAPNQTEQETVDQFFLELQAATDSC